MFFTKDTYVCIQTYMSVYIYVHMRTCLHTYIQTHLRIQIVAIMLCVQWVTLVTSGAEQWNAAIHGVPTYVMCHGTRMNESYV